MKKLLILFVWLIIASCHSDKTEEYSHEVKLINNWGTVKLILPTDFDTSFAWLHISDCKCCDQQKYRIQRSTEEISMENGWFTKGEADTFNRLTIRHPPNIDCFKNFHVDTATLTHMIERNEALDPKIKTQYKSIEKINNRLFAILGFTNDYPIKDTKTLLALTGKDSIYLEFKYESNIPNSIHSIDSMLKYLRTVKID